MKLIITIKDGMIAGAYSDTPVDLSIVETDSSVNGGKPVTTKPELQPLAEFEMPPWFLNHYRCGRCGNEWSDEWSATCDDDCPKCGARHWSPVESEDLIPSIP